MIAFFFFFKVLFCLVLRKREEIVFGWWRKRWGWVEKGGFFFFFWDFGVSWELWLEREQRRDSRDIQKEEGDKVVGVILVCVSYQTRRPMI